MSPQQWLAFVTITLIWGSTWFVIKTQIGIVPVSWSVTWRFLLAGIAMLIICVFRRVSLRIGAKGHGFAALIGVLQFSLNFNLVYRAEEHVTSGLVALTYALLLVPNAGFSALFLGHRITGRFALGSLLGIVGVAMLFARDLGDPGANVGVTITGLALAAAGVLSASAANVMQASPVGRALPLQAGLAWAMFYGCLANAGFALFVAGPPVFDGSPGYIAGLVYLGVLASAVAFSLYYRLIREIGAGRAAYSGVIVPLVAMALSTLFENYLWSPLAVAGALLTSIGLVVALRGKSG